MGATKDKMHIKKNGVNVILDARKGKNKSTVSYLEAKIYAPEGSSTQETNINLPQEKKFMVAMKK